MTKNINTVNTIMIVDLKDIISSAISPILPPHEFDRCPLPFGCHGQI